MLKGLLSGRSHDAILNNFDPRSFNIDALSTSNGVENGIIPLLSAYLKAPRSLPYQIYPA